MPYTENKFNQAIDSNNITKSVDCEEEHLVSKKENNLDISCIALRTRRKSICSLNNSKQNAEKKNTQNVNPLNDSCIALRTRRKTVCGRTDFNKEAESKSSQFNESFEIIDLSTDDDDTSEHTDSDIHNFIVDDNYEESDNKFEISCIANRTRRRKSLKCQRLPKIDELSDYNISDSIITRKLQCNRRINSRSYEEFNTATAAVPKAASMLKLENFPMQNFASILKVNNKKRVSSSNTKHYFNYHPSNYHHPHNSNRNRI
ncbi:hypothetical protein EVAR_69941_1 [Eumeta japonica]|uniref:Uncharacterized protein n=1 Tax=Eumeta variegata TaxID=151549 RepID=A0A4C1T2F4_EUMVA|nr:hypothetical protein EVAR_69941_1 [Eumeta japonica]